MGELSGLTAFGIFSGSIVGLCLLCHAWGRIKNKYMKKITPVEDGETVIMKDETEHGVYQTCSDLRPNDPQAINPTGYLDGFSNSTSPGTEQQQQQQQQQLQQQQLLQQPNALIPGQINSDHLVIQQSHPGEYPPSYEMVVKSDSDLCAGNSETVSQSIQHPLEPPAYDNPNFSVER